MGLDARQYAEVLAQLAPPGVAFNSDPESNIAKLLAGMGDEFDRVYARIQDLIDESDPRTTFELLAEWESAYGLPEKCGTAPTTYEARIAALVEKVTRRGGASRQYFIDRAAAIGFVITITEFEAFSVNTAASAPIYGIDWRFAWQVNAPETTIAEFTANSSADTAIRSWGNEPLECLINRLKPAHTIVLFAYG